MPISLPPLSRRSFLQGTLAAGAGVMLTGAAGSPQSGKADPHRFALLSDTHIPKSADVAAHGVNMTENLRQVVAELLALETQPAATLISGDCAYLHGLPEDYANLLTLIKPLREAGQPLHLVLGNHDHRERILKALPAGDAPQSPLPDRRVEVIESPRANWFLLDSLMTTNRTPGMLGEQQLGWLADELDRRDDRPALVVVHHNPDTREKPSGLTDTAALMDVVAPRQHVQAVIFGHTHAWSHVVRNDGLHLVNLPPTGYVFVKAMPNGWVDARVGERGMTLELRCLDAAHSQHGQMKTLNWRT
jgi:3',5'-cyclic AMP phosphodiesterase CpdA